MKVPPNLESRICAGAAAGKEAARREEVERREEAWKGRPGDGVPMRTRRGTGLQSGQRATGLASSGRGGRRGRRICQSGIGTRTSRRSWPPRSSTPGSSRRRDLRAVQLVPVLGSLRFDEVELDALVQVQPKLIAVEAERAQVDGSVVDRLAEAHLAIYRDDGRKHLPLGPAKPYHGASRLSDLRPYSTRPPRPRIFAPDENP